MTFFSGIDINQTLMPGVTGGVVAQVLKTILDIVAEPFVQPGASGWLRRMPSSHSSTVFRWQRRRGGLVGTESGSFGIFHTALFWRWYVML